MSNILEKMSAPGARNYIPVATNNNLGIASFYSSHFEVVDGKVHIKKSYFQSIFEKYVTEAGDIKIDVDLSDKIHLASQYDALTRKYTVSLHNDENEELSSTSVTFPSPGELTVSNSFDAEQSMFKTTLIDSVKGELSSSSVELPFDNFANKLELVVENDTTVLKLLHDTTVLSSVALNIQAGEDVQYYDGDFTITETEE